MAAPRLHRRVLDNALYGGSGVLYEGEAELAALEGNEARAGLAGQIPPPRPTPPVPSIFEWQRENL